METETGKILRELNEERASLKPCPYCRGKARVKEFAGWFYVLCLDFKCFASGPQRSTREEAMEAWNRGAEDARN